MMDAAPNLRRPLVGPELDRALSGLEGSSLRERRLLEAERDPILYNEGLLSLAARQEKARHPELAARIYAEIGESDSANPETRKLALRRLAALRGEGRIGDRAEILLSRFFAEASDPVSLFAMTAAGSVFRATRLFSLARLAGSHSAHLFSRGLGAKLFSSGLAFVAEAATFPLAARLGNLAFQRQQDWGSSALGRELASSFLLLGGLRAGGIIPKVLTGGGTSLYPLAVQAGMFGGILLGHEMEVRAGLRERTSGAITLIDSFSTLLQFNVAGRMSRSLMGEGMRAWERRVQAQTSSLERPLSNSPLPPLYQRGVATALAGDPSLAQLTRPKTPESEPLFMTGGEGGGQRPSSAKLMRAATLRIKISPDHAWGRREEQARHYLQLLNELPEGKRSSLQEILEGTRMFGNWALTANSLQQAIGFRYYAEAWRILRMKFNHVEADYELERRIVEGAQNHRRLISEESNRRFLQSAVKASVSVSSVLMQHRIRLVEGSPREKDLLGAMEQVLTSLRMGSEMLANPALRRSYLEALLDSLQAVQAGGELSATQTLAGIRSLRRGLQSQDPSRRGLATEFYPQFWRLFRTVTQVNTFEGLDFGMAEEIAFLQQNHSLRAPAHLLEPVLKAFPYYVGSQLALHSEHSTQLSIMLDAFLIMGREFRGSVPLTASASTRENFVQTYIDLLLSCREASLQLLPRRNPYLGNAPQNVLEEMGIGLRLLRERWSSESGDFQTGAFEQYWALAKEYPVAEGVADQISSEINLKPLAGLAGFSPNPQVRRAAEVLLARLLDRFPPGAPRQ